MVEEDGFEWLGKKEGGTKMRFSDGFLLDISSDINASASKELSEEVSDYWSEWFSVSDVNVRSTKVARGVGFSVSIGTI